jgi:hypothetical protein
MRQDKISVVKKLSIYLSDLYYTYKGNWIANCCKPEVYKSYISVVKKLSIYLFDLYYTYKYTSAIEVQVIVNQKFTN